MSRPTTRPRTLNGRIQRTSVLGVGISAVNPASAAQQVLVWVREGTKHYVAVTGVHGVMEAQRDPTFQAILNEAGMTVPDGMPLVWLSKLAGHHSVARVFGPDFMRLLGRHFGEIGARFYYYGGADGVADALAKDMEARFPGLKTAGVYSPPFRDLTGAEEDEVARAINSAKPDVVWVGLSTPKQERWMAKFRPLLNAPALVGVGAAFDYNTGALKRAPAWMQHCGMEWSYRIFQDPRRLWRRYAKNNPLFIYYLTRQKLRLKKFFDAPN